MGTFARGKGQVVFVGSYDLLGHPFGPQIVTWLSSRPPEPGAPAGAETKRLKPVPVPQSTDPAPADREGYAALAAEAGRDADAHVRLALWCEARGMEVAYREHLRMAVDIAPDHPTARGLLHQLADGARWQTIEDAADRSRGDRALSKALDEYDGRRRAARDTADDQWKLAVWCEENHLPAEARAHYTVVTRLAPNRSEAWLKLGYKRYESRWLTPEQIAAERAEARAQREADAYWQPRIESLAKRYFGGEQDTDELLRNAGEITDPRAVPAIWRAFAGKKAGPKRQEGAARLLAQIESPVATQRLTALAVFGQTPRARVAATEVLRRRDPRDYVETLISLLYSPLKYQLRLPSIDDRTSALEIEGELYTLRRIFVPVRGTDSDVTAVAQGAATAVRAHNALLRLVNAPALTLLSDTTEQYLGPDKEQWQKWWAEQKGYAYVRPKTKPVYTIVQRVTAPPRVSHSCFGAGTPVRTPTGLRPIEELQVGDQVLSQDVQTGALSFRPIVAVFHNPPNQTVRVGLGKENIVATPIHRFWKAGAGWVMARDLKVGDTIRTLQGRERVVSLESGEVVPVFNLEVSDGRNFFVGQQGALVHDNTLVEAVPQPFDAASVAVAGKTGSAH